jgi:chemotaxis methyl-accepting protein methylase
VSSALLSPPPAANPDYRHIVFADERRPPRRPLNLAPSGAPVVPPARAPGPLAPAQLAFARWLLAKAGLDACDYREETVARRLPACLRMLRVECADQARALIESDSRRLRTALDAMLVGVTGFFRDGHVFTALRDSVISQIARGRLSLRAWCAGCSSGAEVYSLAMLLTQVGWLHRAHLLGTDCRPGAIAEASAGLVEESAMCALPRDWVEQFFTRAAGRVDGAWHLRPALRAMLHWRVADVLRDGERGPWDLIFCRNLAMYLRPDAASRLWRRLYAALRPGGVLVLGKAERPTGVPLACLYPCIFQRDLQHDVGYDAGVN